MNSDLKYQRIIQAVVETPWAILPQKFLIIRDLLALRATGQRLTDEEIAERIATSRRMDYRVLRFTKTLSEAEIDQLKQAWNERWVGASADAPISAASSGVKTSGGGGVAVLPLVGTIIPRADLFTEMSGGMSVQRFTRQFREALADHDVASIVIDVDSPGGQVSGVEELSREIFGARGQKPITAVANTLAASAAYWIATAADELVVTPSGEVGSIGVLAMHEDVSRWLDQEGIAINLISAGKYKTEGNPFEPLSEEARAAIQSRVDEYYTMFVDAVARNRGVKRADVRGGFGQGRVVGAKEAVALGMADRVATLDETVERMLSGRSRRRGTSADLDFRRRRLRLHGN